MASWKVALTSRRIDGGNYIVNDRYFVQRGPDGWRWHDGNAEHVGGAVCATKAEAMDALDRHINYASGRYDFALAHGWVQ